MVPVRRPARSVALPAVVLRVVGDAGRRRGGAEGVLGEPGLVVSARRRLGRLERAAYWCRCGVLAVQALLIVVGFVALHEGARDTAIALGTLGLTVSLMMLPGDVGRRDVRRMVE